VIRTDSAGRFSVTGTGNQTTMSVFISAPRYVGRVATLQTGSNRDGVVIDLIANQPPFSMSFYNDLVRGVLDFGAPSPTRRWQQDPSFYVTTVDEFGAPVAQSLVDTRYP
jgi:hypothetical protein